LLLACGIGYGVAYIVANDVIAAAMWENYNPIDQAISELSGTGAPSKDFLMMMLPVFSLMVGGFGIGVWKAAGKTRSLRVTGGILLAQSVMFPLWLLFPMSSREELAAGSGGANDIGHGVLGALALLFIITEMGFSAAAFGKRFRYFSIAMAILTVLGGAYMAMSSSAIEAGDPTPWMGFIERIMYGAWLLWMAVPSVLLLRRDVDAEEL